eukprot:12149-Heterococcus_DN1.PRE.5
MQSSKQGSVAHQTKLVRVANRGRWLIRQRSYVLTDTAALTAVTKHQSMLISHSEVRSLSQSLQYRVAIEGECSFTQVLVTQQHRSALGAFKASSPVVGWAVQGAAVVGLGVAVRDSNRTRRVATQGSVAHQTKLVRVNRYCSLKSTDQTPGNAHLTQKLVTITLVQSSYATCVWPMTYTKVPLGYSSSAQHLAHTELAH